MLVIFKIRASQLKWLSKYFQDKLLLNLKMTPRNTFNVGKRKIIDRAIYIVISIIVYKGLTNKHLFSSQF